MIYGLRFEVDNELYVEINLREYVRIENNVANINLPERVMPEIIDSTYLKILYAKFNPKLIYQGNARGTIEGWSYLESQQVDLSKATSILAMDEIVSFLVWNFLPAKPIIISIPEIAYLVNHLRKGNVRNLEHYIPKIRRKIGSRKRGAIRYAINGMHKGIPPPISARQLEYSIFSIISELRICREIVDKGYDVEFNPHSKGPDLYLNGRSVKLEVATKFDQLDLRGYEEWAKNFQKNPEEHSIEVDLRVLSASLLLLLADKLGEELRQGDIVIIDVSSTLEGFTMLALKLFSREPPYLEFDTAINRALELVNEGKKAIILYTRSREYTATLCIDSDDALKFIKHVEKHAGSLISLRRKHPYKAIRLLSTIFH